MLIGPEVDEGVRSAGQRAVHDLGLLGELEDGADGDEAGADHHALVEPEAARQAGGEEAAEEHGEEGGDAHHAAVDGLEAGVPKAALAIPSATLLSTKSSTSPASRPTRQDRQLTWPRSASSDGGALPRRRRARGARAGCAEPGDAAWPWTSSRV